MKSQQLKILAHLKSGKTITQGEAIDLCKCYQLDAIRDLVLNLYDKVIHGCERTTIVYDLVEMLEVLDGEEVLP